MQHVRLCFFSVQRLFLYDESKRSDEQPSVKLYFGKFISYRCPETGEYGMEVKEFE